jgi:hypothetical protein
MRGQTVVIYNDITLVNCLTRRFEQEVIPDDSRTDVLKHHFVVRVVGYCTAESFNTIGKPTVYVDADPTTKNFNPNYNSAALQFRTVRHQLGEYRKKFQMFLGADDLGDGGQPLLEAHPWDGTSQDMSADPDFDVENGPKPRVLSVTHVSADEVVRVEFEIEIWKLECDPGTQSSGTPLKVLSNRWSVIDQLDREFMTTRTYDGILKMALPAGSPNDFRGWVVPSIQAGMRRENMTFRISEDNLTLRYTIVDREVVYSAPLPATAFSYSHTETALKNKTMGYGTIEVSATAPRDYARTQLIALVAAIIDSQLILTNLDPKQTLVHNFVEEYSITDQVGQDGSSWVHGHCRVMRAKLVNRFHETFSKRIGKPLDSQFSPFKYGDPNDPNSVPYDKDYDSNYSYNGYPDANTGDPADPLTSGEVSPATAFACYLQDSCRADEHRISKTQLQNGDSYQFGDATKKTDIVIRRDQDLTEDQNPPLENIDHVTSPYTHYRQDSRIYLDTGMVQLPLAQGQNQGGGLGSGGTGEPGGGGLSGQTYYQGGGQQSCVICSLWGPLYSRVVIVEAERVGQWPLLPAAQDVAAGGDSGQSYNQILLCHKVVAQTRDRTADDQIIYRVNAEYEFALDSFPSQNLPVGTTPWMNQQDWPYLVTNSDVVADGGEA